MNDAEMLRVDRGDGVDAAVDTADLEGVEIGDVTVIVSAGGVVRKLRRVIKNAEESGAEAIKVPVGKYTALLRDAETVIRALYAKAKATQAQLDAERNAPVVYRQVDCKVFPGRLRAARKAAGMTQGDLAHRAKLSYATICQLERGVRVPKWYRVQELATALGCAPEWLGGSREVVVCPEQEN